MDRLTVSELFGPTIQGEGPFAGRTAVFLRLGGCNLDCRWCDTPYTWDWTGKNGTVYDRTTELADYTVARVVDRVNELVNQAGDEGCRLVLTGGEPMLQRKALNRLVEALRHSQFGTLPIDVETNGTVGPLEDPTINYVISPKIGSSGVEWKPRWHRTIAEYKFKAKTGSAFLKFVIGTRQDVDDAVAVIPRGWPATSIWFMPEGRTAEELNLSSVARVALEYGYQVSDRLHVRIWGDERGH